MAPSPLQSQSGPGNSYSYLAALRDHTLCLPTSSHKLDAHSDFLLPSPSSLNQLPLSWTYGQQGIMPPPQVLQKF